MVSTVLVSFLFAVLLNSRCPRAQPFVKVGARAPVPHGVGATGTQSVRPSIIKIRGGVIDTKIISIFFIKS